MRDAANGARPSARRDRWSQSKGFSVVRDWQSSGQSASTYCEERKVEPHRLRYWSGRFDESLKGERDFYVVPLKRGTEPPPEPENLDGEAIEIRVRGHVTVRVPGRAGQRVLADALRAVLAVVG